MSADIMRAMFMIYLALIVVGLRQRGSPESKPVGASHAATGVEG